MSANRAFPMLDGPPIPRALAEVIYEAYCAACPSGQSLHRIAERGGFGWAEVGHLFKELRRKGPALRAKLMQQAALAIEAGTDETLQAAQPVGQERGPQGNAQPQSLSHKYSMKEEPNGY